MRLRLRHRKVRFVHHPGCILFGQWVSDVGPDRIGMALFVMLAHPIQKGSELSDTLRDFAFTRIWPAGLHNGHRPACSRRANYRREFRVVIAGRNPLIPTFLPFARRLTMARSLLPRRVGSGLCIHT